MNRFIPRRLAGLLLVALFCLLPACAKKEPEKKVEFGPKVTGKVTYKGEPVPYGMVLFYTLDSGRTNKFGELAMLPAAMAPLNADGTYEIDAAPVGPIIVCVATDPDTPPQQFIAPSGFGPPRPDGGSPVGDAPPLPGPPLAGGAPVAEGGPPAPKDLSKMPAPGKIPNPLTDKMSDSQKQRLREIHDKYGSPGKSTLAHAIPDDQERLTYDITLK
jgi:hypothetical protein